MNENNKPIDPEQIIPENDLEQTAPAEETIEVQQEAEPAAAEKGTSKKKPVLIAALVAALVVVIAIIVGTVLTSRPLAVLAKGAKNSYEALKNNEIVLLIGNIAKGGSIEASADLETLTESMLGYGMEGSAVIKLYADDKPAAAVEARVEMEGENLLDLTLVTDQEEIAVNSTSLLGGNAYGIRFDDIEKNFESSAFGPDGAYSIGMELEELQEVLDSVKNNAADSDEFAAIMEDLLGVVLKSVTTHAEIEKDRETLTFAGEECKTTAVTIHADAAALLNICGEIVDYCRTDSQLRAYLTENSDILVAVAQYDGYYDMDAEELLEYFYETLDELAQRIADAKKDVEDLETEIDLTFFVTKSGSYLVGAELAVEFYEETARMEAFIGPDLQNIKEISFRYDDGYDKIKGSYVVKANDKKEYSATLKIKEDSETVFSGSIDWDKAKGDLEIEFADEWDSYALSCEMEHSSKATVIRVLSYEDEYEELDIGVTVTLKGSDKMPSISKYTDILVMDEDEVEDIIYDIMDVVYELSYLMY